MSNAPIYDIDPAAFAADPYPDLARMRAQAPIAYVPQLGATLLTRRDTIHAQEKRTDVFSSHQPGGLMTVLMGENLMRKDGQDHQKERKILFPALSPRTVQDHWRPIFEAAALEVLDGLRNRGSADFVTDFAMPVSARALIAITGLAEMSPAEMDGCSQAMIDGCANYAGDSEIEARCHAGTALIDAHIDRMLGSPPPRSALAVQLEAGLPMESVRANIKLIISGGQNEPRDAIAGTVWALLGHQDALEMIARGQRDWTHAFAEYVRWISPIGMSPRRVARRDTIDGVTFEPEDRAFLMFSSASRDEAHFDHADAYDITRDTQASIPFGAGPHFCAGAAASRSLITQVALPLAFKHLKNLALDGETTFTGWAFRGPTAMPVTWEP